MHFPQRISLTLKFLIGAAAVIAVTIGTLFYVLNRHQEKLILEQVEHEARMIFKQVVLMRRFIADHGGIFVEKLPWVKPNPYLKDREPEILDIKGRKFVRQNPAMVTKELSKYGKEKGVSWFRITSLKPINPDNAPDDFERESLMLFEEGNAEEISKIEAIDRFRYMRYIAPLLTESACLDCHSKQGYRIGDIRGAISVTIPVENVFVKINENRKYMTAVALFTSGLLMAGLYVIAGRLILLPVRRLNTLLRGSVPDSLPAEELSLFRDEIEDLNRSVISISRSVQEQRDLFEQKMKGAVNDLTEKNRILSEMNEELMKLSRNKSDFVAKVSHEMRTPLTSIKGAMDYISVRLQTVINSLNAQCSPAVPAETEIERAIRKDAAWKLDDLLAFFEIIKKNSERLIRMVNDILDLERIEQGRTEMHFTELDLSSLIEEVIIELSSSAAQKNIDVTSETPDCLPVTADEDRIRRVLINLISNAIKFSPEGSSVNIKAVSSEECIMVIVKDSGPGIPVGEQDKIFERFYKRGNKEGTGLGLAISKGIIEAHWGITGVLSDGRNGSSFFFRIPKSLEKGVCRTKSSL